MSHVYCMDVGVCQESDVLVDRGEIRKSVSWLVDDKGQDITTVAILSPQRIESDVEEIRPRLKKGKKVDDCIKKTSCCSLVKAFWRSASFQAKKGVCNCLGRLWRRFNSHHREYQEIE